jgi:hypothetical protein
MRPCVSAICFQNQHQGLTLRINITHCTLDTSYKVDSQEINPVIVLGLC